MQYEPVIGLEVHVQLNTRSKLFCGCSADHFGKKPNTQTCPVCLGLPGAIPAPPNIAAIKKAVLAARALGCRVAKECCFERKHYFYPDLPKGYQISQHRTAIGLGGKFEGVSIARVHLEEDAAKLVHEPEQTLIDFNRAGVPLLEIVTEPEVPSPSKAKTFLKELRTLFRYLKISDADMEKGSMRLEANISLRKVSSQESGVGGREVKAELPDYRVELKNINSFRFLEGALEYEIGRQMAALERGQKLVQETRGYNEKTGKTFLQRAKEEAADYRYFPEPDLPPLTAKILSCEGEIVRPEDLRKRFEKKYDLPQHYARVLVADPELAALFEAVAKEFESREVANAIVNRRFGDPRKLGVRGLVEALKARAAKKDAMLSDEELEPLVDEVIRDNQQAVGDYKAGKDGALQFLLGQLMKETRGKINPGKARELLRKKLTTND